MAHTIIIDAGAAGLAVGACLKKAGIPNIILEQSDKVGARSQSKQNKSARS